VVVEPNTIIAATGHATQARAPRAAETLANGAHSLLLTSLSEHDPRLSPEGHAAEWHVQVLDVEQAISEFSESHVRARLRGGQVGVVLGCGHGQRTPVTACPEESAVFDCD
jgi:hypothetical protein